MRIRIDILSGILFIVLPGCERPDPEALRERMHLPGPDFRPDVARGNELFHANCAKCHGLDARGTDKGPPLVDKVYVPSHHADLVFHFAVRDGAKQHHWRFGDMPPQAHMSPEQIGHIIA